MIGVHFSPSSQGLAQILPVAFIPFIRLLSNFQPKNNLNLYSFNQSPACPKEAIDEAKNHFSGCNMLR
jgi:hypothetical protein